MENELILPEGYGIGTIVYNLENKSFEATEFINASGLNLYKIEEVEKNYANKRIEQGAKKLISQ
jgi:hypothetical protein